jgi:hypothetical protein
MQSAHSPSKGKVHFYCQKKSMGLSQNLKTVSKARLSLDMFLLCFDTGGMTNFETRFWSKVWRCEHDPECSECCWLWTGGTLRRGYGCVRVEGKTRQAHRVSYEYFNGPIPEGMVVCHQCDKPACVNPSHLWIGTPGDNLFDRHDKGRSVQGECHGRAILNNRQVQVIRAASACGIRRCELADIFGVSHTSVRRVILGQRWAHLPWNPEVQEALINL